MFRGIQAKIQRTDNLFHDCYSQSIFYLLTYLGSYDYIPAFCLLYPFRILPDGRSLAPSPAITHIDFDFLLTAAGAASVECIPQKNIVGQLIQNLNSHRLLLLPVDCFYDEFYKYTFGRIHKKHYILVFDYNRDKSTFCTVRHDYLNETNYHVEEIPFHTLALQYNLSRKFLFEEPYLCFWKKSWHQRVDPLYGFGYVLHIISRYRKFLRFTDRLHQTYIQAISTGTNITSDYITLVKQISRGKNKISAYYNNNWQSDHILCKMTNHAASVWEKLLKALAVLKESTDEKSVMRLQIYHEELLWQEEELMKAVKGYYEKIFEI